MRIRWTESAVRSFVEHLAHAAADSLDAAQRLRSAVVESVERLNSSPHRGRPGQRVGTRELMTPRFPAYVVVYRVIESEIRIICVWYKQQNLS